MTYDPFVGVSLEWWSSAFIHYLLYPVVMVLLCLLSIFVVLGNLLVMTAIWHESQLHSVTNYLIASLAAADCLVGALVMPFCIISEVIIGSWTFGPVFCDLWHSFDVLASTASIMNLCAISLDRYLAITSPISYPRRMTNRRVALLIVSLWTCSALISFPAILWWRAVGHGPLRVISQTDYPLTNTPNTTDISPPIIKCEFTDDTYYLLFSSFVSFYGPLCIMLYAYYRIYKAAVKQTRFLKHGSKQVSVGKKTGISRNRSHHSDSCEKNSSAQPLIDGNALEYGGQHLILRAHRGGGGGGSTRLKVKGSDSLSSPSFRSSINERERKSDSMRSRTSSDITRDPSKPYSSLNLENSPKRPVGQENMDRMNTTKNFNFRNLNQIGRDKLRVISQRFEPSEWTLRNLDQKSNVNSMDDKARANDHLQEQQKQNRYGKNNGKSLIASIDEKLSCVDSTVVNDCVVGTILQGGGHDKEESLMDPKDLQACSLSNLVLDASSTSNENADRLSGGTAESLVSSSSGTYGTNSIVSVIVKDTECARDNQTKSSSDRSLGQRVKRFSLTSVRRSLSLSPAWFGGSELEPVSSDDKIYRPNIATESQDNRYQSRHRVSCGDPSLFNSPGLGLVEKKTKDTRSIGQSLLPSNDSQQLGDKTNTRAPSKPLIVLNHEPSVQNNDEIKKASGLESEKSNKVYMNSIGTNFVPNRDGRTECNQIIMNENEDDGHKNVERGKVQMIYYDSDRLIQSIVDLTAIQYIDSQAQNGRDGNVTIDCDTELVTETDVIKGVCGNQPRLTQNDFDERVDVTRQQKRIGKKLSKLAKEKKAAKTLGIVVGVFVLCWLPFFVVNIVVALCGTNCVYKFEISNALVTWLGWLNSAMNPVIYACWSRDFRRAFSRVLVTWIEFICPFDGACLTKRLRLKGSRQESYNHRTNVRVTALPARGTE